jgi:acyl-CoA synthetase (NDP forming)
MTLHESGMPGLEALFSPRSVAIIGASADATRIGGRPVEYLMTLGYGGSIYPVNPVRDNVQELPAYRSISAIGKPVDLAIIAVPAAQVVETLRQCATAGVKAVVLFSSGFAEIGAEGKAMQDEVTAIARASRMRVVGPNCLGVISAPASLFATFSPLLKSGVARAGAIGLVSQSGAFGAYAYGMARERGLGLSHWITTGNEADVELADAIAFFAGDPDTRVILAYCEGVRNGPKFLSALAAARAAGKPVVITKVGRSDIGAAAAASHTASLAGEDAVYDAVFSQYGAIRARTVDELFDYGYAFSLGVRPRGNRLAIVTVSGGVGVLMADEAADAGVELPEASPQAQARILGRIAFAGARNPVDVTGQVGNDHAVLDVAIDALLESGRYDGIALFYSVSTLAPNTGPKNVASALRVRTKYPHIATLVVSALRPGQRDELEADGCLCFTDPSRAVRSFAAMARQASAIGARTANSPGDTAIRAGAHSEPDSLKLLASAGLPVVPFGVAQGAASAVREAEALGFPVAMKIVSADILHKSDIGGVRLNIADAQQVTAAYDAILAAAREHAPGARVDGVMVAPMVRGGLECILGIKRDPVFGPVAMVGLGGIHVELFRDIALRLAPFDVEEARAMIDGLRARAMFDGLRGAPPSDIDALARALARLSEFAAKAGPTLESVDINPFVVLPQGAVALDAVVIGTATQM